MPVYKLFLKFEVVGKDKYMTGLLFKRPEYVLALKVIDKRAKAHPIIEQEVSFGQYSSLKVGQIFSAAIYTPDGHGFSFSKEAFE